MVGGTIFFRDFVYRNAQGKKKGDQLVDAIVLFGDVMLLVEIKAQIGSAHRDDWVRDRLTKAVSQIEKTYDLLYNASFSTPFTNHLSSNTRWQSMRFRMSSRQSLFPSRMNSHRR